MVPQPDKNLHPQLIVFGGSFDPPHKGHVGCVSKILERFPSSRVLVMPTPAPPPIGVDIKTPSASMADRLQMCREAFRPFGQKVEVSDLEASLPTPSYSFATLRALQESRAESLGLMVGQDHLEKFDLWRQPIDILRRASLVVVARPISSTAEQFSHNSWLQDLLAITTKLSKRLNLKTEWSPNDQSFILAPWSNSWQSHVFFLSGIVGALSSSKLREELKTKPATEIKDIPDGVGDYILHNRLYQSEDTSTNYQASR